MAFYILLLYVKKEKPSASSALTISFPVLCLNYYCMSWIFFSTGVLLFLIMRTFYENSKKTTLYYALFNVVKCILQVSFKAKSYNILLLTLSFLKCQFLNCFHFSLASTLGKCPRERLFSSSPLPFSICLYLYIFIW